MTATAKNMMHPATILESDVNCVQIASIMAEKNIGSVLIKGDDGEYGIVTERDIIKKVISKNLDPNKLFGPQIMSKPIKTIEHDSDIYHIASLFSENAIRRLPVVEDGQIVGIITTRDVTKNLVPEFYKGMPIFNDMKEYNKKG